MFKLYFQFPVHIEVSSVFGIKFCLNNYLFFKYTENLLTDIGTMCYHAESISKLVCNTGCSCLQLCAL